MVNIIRMRQNSMGSSPRTEVGEIDTRAPFQSVRAAVSLFGDASSQSAAEKPILVKKTKPQGEGVLDREAQLHLAQKVLGRLKEQVKNAEATRADALPKLEKAQKTVENLRDKLKSLNESKQAICEATEALKFKAKRLEEVKSFKHKAGGGNQVQTSKEEYRSVIAELDAAKQELSSMHGDFYSAMQAKSAAFKQAEAAHIAARVNAERVGVISKQIAAMQESLGQVKLATQEAMLEQATIYAERDAELRAYTLSKEEVQRKLTALEKEHGSQHTRDLELKLAETAAEIEALEKDVHQAGAASLTFQNFATELHAAKRELQRVEEEKESLQHLADSLKDELGSITMDISEAKARALQAEASVDKLEGELQKCSMELAEALANQTNTADDSGIITTLEQLASETEKANKEAEEINKTAKESRQEAKTVQEKSAQMEESLSSLLKEAEEAKSSGRLAVYEHKAVSETANATLSPTSGIVNNKIKLSQEQYNSLRERIYGSGKLADIKVAEAMAQVEALVASQMEAAKKLEASLREIEELKVATEEPLKQAAMAEEAKRCFRE